MSVFQRRYELYVVQPFKYEEIKSATQNKATELDVINENSDRLIGYNTYSESRVIYDDSLLITDPIQLEADINYGGSGGGGAEIKLYNLSDKTVKRIQGNQTILLKAGYKTDAELPVLYVGTIQAVRSSSKESKDRVTTLICKEGGLQQRDLQYNHCYIRGTTYSDIIADIADYLNRNGIPTSLLLSSRGVKRSTRTQLIVTSATSGFKESSPRPSVFDEIVNQKSLSSINVSGNVFSSLTSICDSIDYIWFISKGIVYIQPREAERYQDFVELTPDVVVGNISPSDDQSGVSSNDPAAKVGVGVNFTVFLDARLALENYVKIGYGEYSGTYSITSLKHRLNWHNGPWQTSVVTKPIEILAVNQNGGAL